MKQLAVSATRAVAVAVGAFSGLLGVEHGIFETLQGKVPVRSLLIDAIRPQEGSPFQESEPALTLLPNYLVTGIAAIAIGLLVIAWAFARDIAEAHRK